ncbi:Virginiamycin B lyase [Paraconexibacter sp. AEG42_29]|uniref:Virginiamycin B lyase n=1 Tax=Paraconexibacter sp. AEG42_29 TaxID=2997339 RepID=A0AAU7ATF7_9ACTN
MRSTPVPTTPTGAPGGGRRRGPRPAHRTRVPVPPPRRRGIAILAATAGLAVALVAGAATAAPGPAHAAQVKEFEVIGSSFGSPKGITTGPDGNLWIAIDIGYGIGRLTPEGAFSRFDVGFVQNASPQYIAVGPDRALWATDAFLLGDPARESLGVVHRITTQGERSDFPLPTAAGSHGITTGPDGALWYTQAGPGIVGRLATDGTVREFAIPGPPQRPGRIAAGPDGALWFTQDQTGTIGRLTPDGSYRSFTPPTRSTVAAAGVQGAVAAGPDGAMWFTQYSANRIGRIAPDGTVTEIPLPAGVEQPHDLIAGPDGALWISVGFGGDILRLTVDGQFTPYDLPHGGGNNLTVGPGGIWYANFGGYVGRLDTLAPPVVGKTVGAEPVSGRVLVRRRGAAAFTALPKDGSVVPVGTEFDTTAGRVRLTAAAGTGTTVTKTSEFYGGRFLVSQAPAKAAVLDLRLSGPSACTRLGANLPPKKRGTAKGRGRLVWGDGKGTFRTTGRRSSATVRGTRWLTQDRCDGSTLTRVLRGVVSVKDVAKARPITLTAGRSYVARPRKQR